MRLARAACIGCIRAYQILISPMLPPTCRFAPSCSAYAGEAIALHGVMKGLWLAARRILRCHPWGGSGFDPVPRPNRSAPHHPGYGCADRAH